MYVRLSVGGSNKPKWLIYEISQDGDLSLLLPELNPAAKGYRYRWDMPIPVELRLRGD